MLALIIFIVAIYWAGVLWTLLFNIILYLFKIDVWDYQLSDHSDNKKYMLSFILLWPISLLNMIVVSLIIFLRWIFKQVKMIFLHQYQLIKQSYTFLKDEKKTEL